MRELNQLKDTFVGNVSHELCTPITNIYLHHVLLKRAPEDVQRITKRFCRGKSGRESYRHGTGLGLSFATEIAQAHGGRLEIESPGVPGEGATFTLWLPVEGDSSSENELPDT